MSSCWHLKNKLLDNKPVAFLKTSDPSSKAHVGNSYERCCKKNVHDLVNLATMIIMVSVLCSPDDGRRAVAVDNNPWRLPDGNIILFIEDAIVAVGHDANSSLSNQSLQSQKDLFFQREVSYMNSNV